MRSEFVFGIKGIIEALSKGAIIKPFTFKSIEVFNMLSFW
jgi:hypothetical protein